MKCCEDKKMLKWSFLALGVVLIAAIAFSYTISPVNSEARTIEPITHIKKSLFDNVIPGDTNRDGVVNVLDITNLSDYLAFQKGADLDGNGKVNEKDLAILVDKIFGDGAYKKSLDK